MIMSMFAKFLREPTSNPQMRYLPPRLILLSKPKMNESFVEYNINIHLSIKFFIHLFIQINHIIKSVTVIILIFLKIIFYPNTIFPLFFSITPAMLIKCYLRIIYRPPLAMLLCPKFWSA